MSVLRNLAIFIAVVSFFTFVAFFGQLPALRRTPIGWLHRLVWVEIPRVFKTIDQILFAGRFSEKGRRLGIYLFQEKNPVVLTIYLSIVSGSAGLFLWNATHLLPWSLIYPIPILLGLPYYFTYACVVHKAHYITTASHEERLRDYPFDHVLFTPLNMCSTCLLEKPARSKHCSYCGVCVAKCDHHCPWVNNCLGRGNYRYFLALLLSLTVLELYGTYLCWNILRPHLISVPTQDGRWSTIIAKLTIALNRGGLSVAGVGLLAVWTAPLPFGLFCYHAYLIWAGMTTNESQKWSDWRDDMADGSVFKATRSVIEAHNRQRKSTAVQSKDHPEEYNPATSLGVSERAVSWPVDSDQILVQTSDGKPPYGQEALWRRVWSLSDVDNIYDLGTWDNIMEVISGR